MFEARRCWPLALPFVVAATATPAAAADGPEPEAIRLVYRAPDYCPGVDAFVDEVRRAVPRLRVTDREEGVRVFTVSLEPGPRGRLSIARAGALVGQRDVEGSTCEEVADVLAFAVALAVDPNAVRPPPRAGAAAPSSPPSSPPAPLPPPAPPSPPPSGAPSPRVDERPPQATSRAEAAATQQRWWSLAAHGFVAAALAPDATWGGGLAAEMGDRWGALAPAVRFGLDVATTAPVFVDGARVTLANGILWIDGCPHAWAVGPITLRPCVRVDAGVRYAAADGIPNGHGELRPWLDVGAMAHVRSALGGPVFVDLGGGLFYAVVQDRVVLSPDITVYTVHPVGGRGEISFGVEFR